MPRTLAGGGLCVGVPRNGDAMDAVDERGEAGVEESEEPDVPAHRYASPVNMVAERTSSVPPAGTAEAPHAVTETSVAATRSTRPGGTPTRTQPPEPPSWGSRVP